MPWSIKPGSRITDNIDDDYGWYEDEQEGLGERFLAAIRKYKARGGDPGRTVIKLHSKLSKAK